MKLLIVTNAPTFKKNGKLTAYAPYVNEMDMWFKNVGEVRILSPVKYPESVFTKEFNLQAIKIFKLPFLKFTTFPEAILSFLFSPFIIFKFIKAFTWTDHIHIRCPGNIGLIGCIIQIFYPKKPKTAKYAGNWDPQAEQPWTYRFQKWILNNTFLTRNMQVLVYGEWAGQSENITPFFTASFSEKEVEQVRIKKFEAPFTFLFVGNLVEGKRPQEAIKLVEELNVNLKGGTILEIGASIEIYGEGPEREELERYVRENNLEEVVIFQGSRTLEELKEAYQRSHFVILPSRSEGWPKAIAEGMFFGCIPIATPVSCVPWMLDNGSRGVLLGENQESRIKSHDGKKEWSVDYENPQQSRSVQNTNDSGQDILKIAGLLVDQDEMERMSEAAKQWSQKYTLERFEEAIKEVLNKSNQKSSSPFERGGGVG